MIKPYWWYGLEILISLSFANLLINMIAGRVLVRLRLIITKIFILLKRGYPAKKIKIILFVIEPPTGWIDYNDSNHFFPAHDIYEIWVKIMS